jgi:hypothetical protein
VKTRHESVPTRAACRGFLSPHPRVPRDCQAFLRYRFPRGGRRSSCGGVNTKVHTHDVSCTSAFATRARTTYTAGRSETDSGMKSLPRHDRRCTSDSAHTVPTPRGAFGPFQRFTGSVEHPSLCLHRVCSLSSQLSSSASHHEVPHVGPATPRRLLRWSTFLSLTLTGPSGGGEREERKQGSCYVWSGSSSTGSERRAHRTPPAGGAMARLEAPTRTMMHTTDVMETMHVASRNGHCR